MVGFMAGASPPSPGGMPSPARGTAVPLSRWSSGVWGTSKVPQRALVTLARAKVTRAEARNDYHFSPSSFVRLRN